MSAKLVLLTGATILTLALGSVGIAAAQADSPPQEGRRETLAQWGARVYGVIETIEDGSLTIDTPVGWVTVITDANTRFRVPDVEEPGLDDLSIGDILGAVGWWEEEGSAFHAFGVVRAEADHTFPLAGKLTDVSDDTLMVETEHGLATVCVDGETVYRVRGIEEPGLDGGSAELAEVLDAGMRIVAKGTLNLDGSLLAQVVVVPWVGSRPVRLRGEVLAVEEDGFTVRAARGRQSGRQSGHQSGRQSGRQFSVLGDETTEFRVPGVEDPSIGDLHVGDKIAGEGVIEEDGTVRATLVLVLPEQVARLGGEVTEIEGTTLVLDTLGSTVNVLTDADTIFRIPGIEEPALDDVGVGDRVDVVGVWEDETTFCAVGVGVRGDRRPGQEGTVRGRAIHIGDGSLVLGTQRGPVTVLVDDETQYRVPGVDDPNLDGVNAGAMVGAQGTWNEDGTLQATGVAVLSGGRVRDATNGRR